ncbi:MAG: hypothetical protein AAB400_03655 [Patescibacteria group bacterium]
MQLDDSMMDSKRTAKRGVRAVVEEKLHSFQGDHPPKNKEVATLIDRVFEWSLYGMVFLMPLFFLPLTTDVLELNKQLLLFIGTLWLAVLYTGKIIATERIDIQWSPVHIGIGAVLVAWLVTSIYSIYPYNSFWGIEKQEFISFWTLVTLSIFTFITVNELTPRTMINSIYALIASVTLAIAYAVLQLLGIYIMPFDFTKTNAFNTVGLVSLLGVLVATSVVMAIVHIVRLSLSEEKQRNLLSILLALFASLGLIFLIIISERQLWIATILGLGVALTALYVKLPKDKKIMWLVLPSFVVVFSVAMIFISFPRLVALPLTINPSLKTSLSIATSSLTERPLFGTGPGNFLTNYTKTRPQEINNINYLQAWALRFDQSGSYLLTKVAETGALGIISILTLLGLLAWTLGRLLISEPMSEQYVALLALASGFITLGYAAIVKPGNITLTFLMWLLIAFGITYSTNQMNVKMPKLQHTNRFVILSSLALCAVIIVGIVGTLVLVGRYGADQTFARGLEQDQKLSLQLRTTGKVEDAEVDKLIQTLVIANQKNPNHHSYPRVLSQALLYKMNNLLGKEDASKNGPTISALASNAVDSARRANQLNPSDVRNVQNLASTYQAIAPFTTGAESFVEEHYTKSIALDPKNPLVRLEFAKYFLDSAAINKQRSAQAKEEVDKSKAQEVYQQSITNAETQLNEALKLKEDYAQAHLRLAMIRIEQKQNADAEGFLDKAVNENINLASMQSADETIFYFAGLGYNTIDKQNKALDSFRLALGLRPDYSLAAWQAALIEVDKGNKDSAVQFLEGALKYDPQNEIIKKKISDIQNGVTSESAAPVQEIAPAALDATQQGTTETPAPEEKKAE